ncbi:sigma factor-like helix-turn-helix DNA-binding protein [Pseudomonas syringae]|uniref:sigma factor-like helix-turn-helix DNA-binding protein n=1 Tax=Pseudomonas syringae TaxID=317 RepID=UPI000C07DD8D|nr:sigma factor-like helix-turn-helix DNA-binding protein [Pseudomonas syringae]
MARTYSTASIYAAHCQLPGGDPIFEALFPELSSKEAKSVYLYTLGCSLRIIAAELSISMYTAKTYLSRAKEKMGLYSLSDLRQICNARINLQILIFILTSSGR